MVRFSKIPRWLRKILSPILELMKEKRASELMKVSYGRTATEFFDVNRRMQINQDIMYKFWK